MALEVRVWVNFGVTEGMEIRGDLGGEFPGLGTFYFLVHTFMICRSSVYRLYSSKKFTKTLLSP